jgi:hypothetical protein
VLWGGSGRDWFFANVSGNGTRDVLLGVGLGERVDDV